MRIKKIQLKKGYKRFFDLTIDLGEKPKKIIALVGPNGCGKSSVFDGMLYHNNAHGRIGNKTIKDHNYHSMDQDPNFSYLNIEINFTDGDYNTIRKAKKLIGKENTIFSLRSPYRYNSTLKVNESKSTKEMRLNSYGATTSSDLDEKMEESYRRLYVKFKKYLFKQDCKPSKATLKIIGDINDSLKNCLDIEISSLGDIDDGKGTIFLKKQTTQKSLNLMSFHQEKRK
ncbi:MAG: AAA family ATPase [Candidatus Gracilibacteria bacterium]